MTSIVEVVVEGGIVSGITSDAKEYLSSLASCCNKVASVVESFDVDRKVANFSSLLLFL